MDVTIRTLNYWTEADRDHEDLATLVDLVATGRLHPEIGEVADWTETPAPIGKQASRSTPTKTVARDEKR